MVNKIRTNLFLIKSLQGIGFGYRKMFHYLNSNKVKTKGNTT